MRLVVVLVCLLACGKATAPSQRSPAPAVEDDGRIEPDGGALKVGN